MRNELRPRRALLGALLVALAAPVRAGERLEFRPAPGARQAKTWVDTHKLVLVGLSLVRDGLEQSTTEQVEVQSVRRLDLVDEYRRGGEGRPLELWRDFERLRLRADLALRRAEEPLNDVLYANGVVSGTSVVFTWQPELGEYGRYYDRAEADEAQLARMAEEADLRSFLPGREVSAGDEWTVPTDAARQLFSPGGDLEMRFEKTPHVLFARSLMMGVGGGLWNAFGEGTQGALRARYAGPREVEGRRVGVVELVVELHSRVDQTELANRLRNVVELVQGVEVREAWLDLQVALRGELTWDLEAGLPHALVLTGDEKVHTYRRIGGLSIEVPEPQRPPEVQEVRMDGIVRIELETKPPEGSERGAR